MVDFSESELKMFGLDEIEGDSYYFLSSVERDRFVYELVVESISARGRRRKVKIEQDRFFFENVFDFLTKVGLFDEVERFLLPSKTSLTKEEYVNIKLNEKERLNPNNPFIVGFDKRIDEFLKTLNEPSRKSYKRFLTKLEVHMFDFFKDKTYDELSLEVFDSYIEMSIKKQVRKKSLITSLSSYKRFFDYFDIKYDKQCFKEYKKQINEEIIEEQKLLTREELLTLDQYDPSNEKRMSFFTKIERIREITKFGIKNEDDRKFIESHTKDYISDILCDYEIKIFGMAVGVRKDLTTSLLYSLIRYSFIKIDEIPRILLSDYVNDEKNRKATLVVNNELITLHSDTKFEIDCYIDFREKYDKKIYHHKIIRSIVNNRPFLVNTQNDSQITVTERDILSREICRTIEEFREEITKLTDEIEELTDEIEELSKTSSFEEQNKSLIDRISKEIRLKTRELSGLKYNFLKYLIYNSEIEKTVMSTYKKVDELVVGSRSKRLESVSIRKIINENYTTDLIENKTYTVLEMLRKSAIYYYLEDLEKEVGIKERLRSSITDKYE